MPKPIHFEIHVDDMDRAKAFYATVFGWTYEDYTDYAGQPYFGAIAGQEEEAGINGALMLRHDGVEPNGSVNGAVLTMGTDDFDATAEKVLAAGGASPCRRQRCPAWPGRATFSTPRETSLASTSRMRTLPDSPAYCWIDALLSAEVPLLAFAG